MTSRQFTSFIEANFVFHGFVRAANGTITSFDVPGASQGIFALSINPMGAITGYYTDASGVNHGFLRTP